MEKILRYRRIAIDYDGTIAPNTYPEISTPYPEAVRVMKRIKQHGGRIIIWTCRTGHDAKIIKQKLKDAEVEYDTFNEQLPENLEIFPDDGRKIFADVYIDDRANFCESIDWNWIESKLFGDVEG